MKGARLHVRSCTPPDGFWTATSRPIPSQPPTAVGTSALASRAGTLQQTWEDSSSSSTNRKISPVNPLGPGAALLRERRRSKNWFVYTGPPQSLHARRSTGVGQDIALQRRAGVRVANVGGELAEARSERSLRCGCEYLPPPPAPTRGCDRRALRRGAGESSAQRDAVEEGLSLFAPSPSNFEGQHRQATPPGSLEPRVGYRCLRSAAGRREIGCSRPVSCFCPPPLPSPSTPLFIFLIFPPRKAKQIVAVSSTRPGGWRPVCVAPAVESESCQHLSSKTCHNVPRTRGFRARTCAKHATRRARATGA